MRVGCPCRRPDPRCRAACVYSVVYCLYSARPARHDARRWGRKIANGIRSAISAIPHRAAHDASILAPCGRRSPSALSTAHLLVCSLVCTSRWCSSCSPRGSPISPHATLRHVRATPRARHATVRATPCVSLYLRSLRYDLRSRLRSFGDSGSHCICSWSGTQSASALAMPSRVRTSVSKCSDGAAIPCVRPE